MKKVVVTGGNGFIGSNLVSFLLKKKYYVINIDKNKYSKSSYLLNKIRKKNYKFYKIDINSKKIFKILIRHKPEVIFNLAAETHVDRSIDTPADFIKTNIFGTFNLLEQIRTYKKKLKKNIRLVHISTDEVYGDLKKKERAVETSPYKPSSPYSASKASADHLIKSYIRTYKIDAVISNCCNNFGPYQFPEKLIPKIISNIFKNKSLPIYAKGKNSREWIYVDDHCEALFRLYLKGKNGESYNVGSGINLQNIDLVKKIIKIFKTMNIKIGNKSKIKFVKDRPGHDFRYALNSNKILRELKWKPKVKFDEGLKKTVIWYLNNKNFLNRIKNKNYEKRLGLKL